MFGHSVVGSPLQCCRLGRSVFLLCVLQVTLSMVYAMVGNISDLISSFNAATWIMYGLSFVSLLIMRVAYRHESPLRVVVWFVMPALMVIISLLLVTVPFFDQWVLSLGSFVVIFLSVPVYFVFVFAKTRPKVFTRISSEWTLDVWLSLTDMC